MRQPPLNLATCIKLNEHELSPFNGMSDLFGKDEITFFDPPTEEQWKSIRQRMNEKQWLDQNPWCYYAVIAKLSYVKAVISTAQSGEINGILIFAHPPNIHIAFVAFYVVDLNYRGRGLGRKMWNLMEEHTDSSRISILHSYDDMTLKYRSSGFPVAGEIFQCIKGNLAELRNALVETVAAKTPTNRIVQIPNEATIEKIAEFDRTILPIDRSAFLDAFFSFATGKAIAKSDDGAIIAYGGTNESFDENELKIGPIYATDFDDVLLLLLSLVRDSDKSKYLVRLPIGTASGQRLAEFLTVRAQAVLSTTPISRSFSRPLDCNIDWNKVFALSGHFAAPLV